MTQDKKGQWWVLLKTSDKESGPAQAVVSFDGKEWEESVQRLRDQRRPATGCEA
jgi:hypothetical protein